MPHAAARKWKALVALAFVGVASAASVHAATYSIADLSPPSGSYLDWSLAVAINNSGAVAGQSFWPNHYTQAMIWNGASTQPLGSSSAYFGFPVSVSGSINTSGQVAGSAYGDPSSNNGSPVAFLWSGGSATNLGTLSGGSSSYGRGINDAGQVVGSSNAGQSAMVPVTWSGTNISALPLLAGTTSGEAWSVNAVGQIVGYVSGQANVNRPVVWTNGTASALDVPVGWTGGYAWSINNFGQIAGAISVPGDTTLHAAIWNQSVITDLGTLPGFTSSNALGMNSAGTVVGILTNPGESYQLNRGFIWDPVNEMRELNGLIGPASGWNLTQAYGINDAGQIVGFGTSPTGAEHGFILTPVPEPGTFSLLLAALGVIGITLRCKRVRVARDGIKPPTSG